MRIVSRLTEIVLIASGLARALPATHCMGPVRHFTPEPELGAWTIGFSNGYVIDTRVGELELPAALRVDESNAPENYYIVQFTGPIQQRWLQELERAGVQPFGYLPHYAVLARLTQEQRQIIADLPSVRWIGLFQPAYKIQDVLLDASGMREIVIMLMPEQPAEPVTALITAYGGVVHEVRTTTFATTVTATVDGMSIPGLARLPEVLWIQEWTEPTLCNSSCQWVVQTGWQPTAPPDTSMAARRVWSHGVRGQGVVLSTTDTGLNVGHNLFRDPNLPVTPPGVWPEHRKVVAFKLYQGASTTESPYHGSHVNGTVAGDDSATGGTSYYDGMAIKARLYFMDLTNASGSFVIPTDFTSVWDTVYIGRGLPDSLRPIVQHSGSWGWSNSSGTYLIQDASSDNYCWRYKDFLNIMAAGNESSTRRIRNPGIAKNILTVGADSNGTASNKIASFSSRGPTQDGRLKPNIMAPGVNLWSAQASGQSGYSQMSGTSMATPAVNGALGLVRCYLREGYYPTGAARTEDRIEYISSALMRSLAMVSADPNVGSYTPPDNNIGWGRIDIDSVLYFSGDSRKLLLVDDTIGIATGEFKEAQFRVASTIPLRVCLAWTDTAAVPNANPTLVNNLNLELVSPTGVSYRGNKYTSGQSTPNPTGWDSINVEECCRVNSPDTGLWTIRVYGHNVRTRARQWFAWSITGDVSLPTERHDVGVVSILAPTGSVDSGTLVIPRAVVRNYGTVQDSFTAVFKISGGYADTVTLALPAGAADSVSFDGWPALVLGEYVASCTTMMAGDINPGNDVAADTFVVVPGTGIEEIRLPSTVVLESPGPNPFGWTTTVRYGLPAATTVRLTIHSVDGRVVRTLANGGAEPGFHTATWDGRDGSGRLLADGVYFCRLTTPGAVRAHKLLKLE